MVLLTFPDLNGLKGPGRFKSDFVEIADSRGIGAGGDFSVRLNIVDILSAYTFYGFNDLLGRGLVQTKGHRHVPPAFTGVYFFRIFVYCYYVTDTEYLK